MSRRPLVCAALVAALGMGACGGGGDDDADERASPPRTRAAALRPAWSAQPGPLWNPPPNATVPWAWTTATSVIVPEKRALTSYRATDGTEEWRVPLPRPICSIADGPNDDGIAAVLLSGGTEVNPEACGVVAAVDAWGGRLLWTRSLRGVSSYGMTDVQIGSDAVAVTNPCDRALTFAVRDGARLATFPDDSTEGCEHSFASDGDVMVDADRSGPREAIAGYDAASGKRRWSVPLRASVPDRGALPEAFRVISASPLVIDASVNDHRFLFRVDPQERALAPIGREASTSFVPVFTQTIGGRVVVQYGQSAVLFAYDPASGDEVSHTVLAPGESAFGVRDGTVVSAAAAGDALRDAGLTVRRTDPATGAQRVLGTGTVDGVAATFGRGTGFDVALSGSTMILHTGDTLAGYRLPAQESSAAAASPPERLQNGELPAAKAVGLCTAISERTKRALGFADPTLAAPANCQWVEPQPGVGIRQLHVSSAALPPAGGLSGTQRARRNVARLRRADTVNHLPSLTPIGGLGDEAAAGTGSSRTTCLARVVARVGNVVILVDVIGSDGRPRAEELRIAERGARLAAADLVAEVDRRR